MRAVNEIKPINVLTRFIATWIKEHSENGIPFSSFEVMRAKPTEQKDIERWILDCNYTYYRLGDTLFELDLFPDDEQDLQEFFAFLDRKMKSIRDSNPLNLRSKQPEALVGELQKDWPPFCKRSRNDVTKIAPELRALGLRFSNTIPQLPAALKVFAQELAEEAHWYRQLERRIPGTENVSERCRSLVPIWCLKEINPLFTLLIWRDERAINELCQQLSEAFSANGYLPFEGGSRHDAYRGVVRLSQQYYLDGLAEASGNDLSTRSISELAHILQSEFFSLDHPVPSSVLPSWLFGKALLIWNVVICSILGPRFAIRPSQLNRTATYLDATPQPHVSDALSGEVLMRRRYLTGEIETVASINLHGRPDAQNTRPATCWRILGSKFDEQARIPALPCDNACRIRDIFVPTSRFDSMGNQIEGIGDSRYHAVLYIAHCIEGDSLVLQDLGSKNGTYVVRLCQNHIQYIVLAHRATESVDEWAKRMHVPTDAVHMADKVVLRRGDLIQLCGSCFEIA